jgi:hypothetical protein
MASRVKEDSAGMIDSVNYILLRLIGLRARLVRSLQSDRGQTTGEYVAIVAVGVALAVGVLWLTLEDPLKHAIEVMAGEINSDSQNNAAP